MISFNILILVSIGLIYFVFVRCWNYKLNMNNQDIILPVIGCLYLCNTCSWKSRKYIIYTIYHKQKDKCAIELNIQTILYITTLTNICISVLRIRSTMDNKIPWSISRSSYLSSFVFSLSSLLDAEIINLIWTIKNYFTHDDDWYVVRLICTCKVMNLFQCFHATTCMSSSSNRSGTGFGLF